MLPASVFTGLNSVKHYRRMVWFCYALQIKAKDDLFLLLVLFKTVAGETWGWNFMFVSLFLLPLAFLQFSVLWWQTPITVYRALSVPLWPDPGLKPISHQGAVWTEWSCLMALSNWCHKACPSLSPGPAQPPSQLHRNTARGLSGGGWNLFFLTDSHPDSDILYHKEESLVRSMSYRHVNLRLFYMHNLIKRAWYSAYTNKQKIN